MRLWGKIEGKLRVITIHNEINKIEKNKNKKNQKKNYIKFENRQRSSKHLKTGYGLTFAQIPKNGLKYIYDTHVSHLYFAKTTNS